MRQTTLPPEMLPRAKRGDGEVIVCRNPQQCGTDQEVGCAFCLRVTTDAAQAVVQSQRRQ